MFKIKQVRSLNVLDGTPESPQDHCHKMGGTLLSPQECKTARCTKSQLDETHFPFIGSIAIPCSTSYRTSSLSFFRKLQRFPETPVSSLYEYLLQYSNSTKAPCNSYRPKMRADSLSLTEEVSQLSTSTSRGVFPQQ